jgi:SAM-dependent methyltransferase
MIRDPYRQLFFAANAVDWPALETTGPEEYLIERLELALGDHLLMVGISAPQFISSIRLRLGLTGQLLVADPNSQALSKIFDYDADWTVLLKAQASELPLKDSYLPIVLCLDSLLDIKDKVGAAREFYRVLSPGGRVIVAQSGPGAPWGKPRPCVFGLEHIFLEAGFTKIDFEENEEMFLFQAQKVNGIFLAPPARA